MNRRVFCSFCFVVFRLWSTSGGLSSALTILKDQATELPQGNAEVTWCPDAVVEAVENKQQQEAATEELKDLLKAAGENSLRDCFVTFEQSTPSWWGGLVEVNGTALHYASSLGNKDAVKVLLEESFNPNAPTTSEALSATIEGYIWQAGSTPLMFASFAGSVEVASLLLDAPNIEVNRQSEDGKTALIWAADMGQVEVVKLLRETANIQINLQDQDGLAALGHAARRSRLKVAELLLTSPGVDVDLRDKDKGTALKQAAIFGYNVEILKLLIQIGKADVNAQDKNGKTALIYAAQRETAEAVEVLLHAEDIDVNLCSKIGDCALTAAAMSGRFQALEMLLKMPGIEVNPVGSEQRTPLLWAALRGHSKVVAALLQIPTIKVNVQDKGGFTALTYAAQRGKRKIVKMLVRVDHIDCNVATKQEKATALILASEKGYSKIVKSLLSIPDIKVNEVDKDGKTALISAAIHGHREVIRTLCGVDGLAVNVPNPKDGMTALMHAAKQNDGEAVDALLKVKGIDCNLQSQEKMTALMLAAERGHVRASIFLSKCENIDVNSVGKDEATALILAASRGQYEAVDTILWAFEKLDKGVDVDMVNKDGMTALMLAAKADFRQVVHLLLKVSRPNVALLNKDGVNALVLAAQNSKESAVSFLTSSKRSTFNESDDDVQEDISKAFMLAAATGHHKAFNNLLSFSSLDIKIVDQDGNNPLMLAVSGGRIEIVQSLLNTREFDLTHRNQAKETALRLAVVAGKASILKLLLGYGASVQESIDRNDAQAQNLALWLGVEFSIMELVQTFADRACDWEILWSQTTQCSGDMKGKCTGGLLRHATDPAIVHELLDWLDRADRESLEKANATGRTTLGPGLTGRSKQAEDEALTAALISRNTKAALALLARGVGEKFEGLKEVERYVKDIPVSSKDTLKSLPDYHLPLNLVKDWNRFHWCAVSCDSSALNLAMNFPTELLVKLLSEGPKHAEDVYETPIDIDIPSGNLRCERTAALFKQLKAFMQVWNLQVVNAIIAGVVTNIGCVGALALELFILKLQTLQERGIWFTTTIPLLFELVALLIVWESGSNEHFDDEGSSSETAQMVRWVVGITAAIGGGILLLMVWGTFASSTLRGIFRRLKKRGNDKLDRSWEKLHCFLGWLTTSLLFLRVVQQVGVVLHLSALLVGTVHAVAITVALFMTFARRIAFLLRLVPGIWLLANLAYCAARARPFELPPSPTLLLIATCLALALADVPGIASSVATSIAHVVELEMVTKTANTAKFTANRLILGRAAIAAHGIDHALGLTPDKIAAGLQNPIEAMRQEILDYGDEDDFENFRYIVEGTSGQLSDYPSAVARALDTGEYHGGTLGPNDFDTGHHGRSLKDWMEVPEVVLAKLTAAEFVAVRFYTSSSFPKINGPLRQEVRPHPWAMVVFLMDRGIKKLRSVQAQVDAQSFASQTVLWRGMKDIQVDIRHFANVGGTEMAPMSTTANEEIARHYATSEVPLLFKYVVGGLKTGVSIQFLSLYPKEEEFLYAPLTFLSLKGHYEDDGTTILVVEPVMS